jgi:hypothetical protein
MLILIYDNGNDVNKYDDDDVDFNDNKNIDDDDVDICL